MFVFEGTLITAMMHLLSKLLIAALGAEMTNDNEVAYFRANPPPVIRELEDKKINIARKIF